MARWEDRRAENGIENKTRKTATCRYNGYVNSCRASVTTVWWVPTDTVCDGHDWLIYRGAFPSGGVGHRFYYHIIIVLTRNTLYAGARGPGWRVCRMGAGGGVWGGGEAYAFTYIYIYDLTSSRMHVLKYNCFHRVLTMYTILVTRTVRFSKQTCGRFRKSDQKKKEFQEKKTRQKKFVAKGE